MKWGTAKARIHNERFVSAWHDTERGHWMLYQLEHNGIATYIGATSSPRIRARIHLQRDMLGDGGIMRVLVIGHKEYIHDLERARIIAGLRRGEPLTNKHHCPL
jgi:hypothetical protein